MDNSPPRARAAAARNHAAEIKREEDMESGHSKEHLRKHGHGKHEQQPLANASHHHSDNNIAYPTAAIHAHDDDLDTRLPYRHGWPLLPSLPVCTSTMHVPKVLSKSSNHMAAFTTILHTHNLPVHALSTTHRFHAGTPLSKQTLTLLIASHVSSAATWGPAIRALRSYVREHSLTLRIEVIDHRVVSGVFTLPVMPYDALAPFMARKKHGIVALLDASGMPWTSLEYFYRGLEPSRVECSATVLIGVPGPEERGWAGVREKVLEKVGGRLAVEIVWREVRKF